MALSPDQIATFSRLLDEALALPASEREAWLAALPPQQQGEAQQLRRMLARYFFRSDAFRSSTSSG